MKTNDRTHSRRMTVLRAFLALAMSAGIAAVPLPAVAQCTSCGAEDSYTPAAWPADAEWVP